MATILRNEKSAKNLKLALEYENARQTYQDSYSRYGDRGSIAEKHVLENVKDRIAKSGGRIHNGFVFFDSQTIRLL